MSAKTPHSLWSWLGRQVGHVKKAIRADVTKPAGPAARPLTPPEARPSRPEGDKVIFRKDQVEELPHPENPNLKLRRTVIDEVIVDEPRKNSESTTDEHG